MPTAAPARSRSKQSITRMAGLPFDPLMVELDQCFVDPTYQRDEQKTLVKRITKDFHPARAGALVLSRRSATSFAIIDGQQRWHAMTNLAKPRWFGIALSDLTVEQEADLFAELFNRVSMHSADRYRANLARRDPDSIAINGILEDYGFTVGKNSSQASVIAAPAALLWIIKGCSGSRDKEGPRFPELLSATLEIVKASWPELDSTTKGQIILKGVAQFLKNSAKLEPDGLAIRIDQDRLVRRLSHTTAPKLWQDAQDAAKGARKTVTSDKPHWMSHAIGTLYNQKNWKP